MTVGEFKKSVILKLPDEYEIILASDTEGNSYRRLLDFNLDRIENCDGTLVCACSELSFANCVVLYPE